MTHPTHLVSTQNLSPRYMELEPQGFDYRCMAFVIFDLHQQQPLL